MMYRPIEELVQQRKLEKESKKLEEEASIQE